MPRPGRARPVVVDVRWQGAPFLKVSITLDVEEAQAADRAERAAQRRR
ncbi:hypothetical protein AB7M42_003942 [Bradyrhizobium diazoefficiens]|jgi:hypothetical protein|nr:hypothetical protein [Bradyrhizobium japonicum]